MSVIPNVTPSSASFREYYKGVEGDLEKVENLLKDFLASSNPFIQRVSSHSSRLGGKRMRPALLLLFAKLCGGISPIHHTLAAAVETIHTASLVHDDILDEARMRRGQPTINVAWSNETSVLLGDFMVARAMRKVIELNQYAVSHMFAEASCRLCEGEMRQVGLRGRFDVSEEDYIQIVRGKTASLFSCACNLGAFCVEGTTVRHHQNAFLFGEHMGVAFQMADDLLDIVGTEEQMGKTLGSDLAKQKLTLPMIRLLSVLTDSSRDALVEEIKNDPGDRVLCKIRRLLEEHAIIISVRQTAREHIEKALDYLDFFPENESKVALAQIAARAIRRCQ
ncbi:MAG: polyprenyl synthetase family protein [Planctomycetia bacterium]|nr:polyprenyl synthetase family protein [Planctomycetia bacterium]